MTKGKAKKRFREYEDTVFIPVQAWIRDQVAIGDWALVSGLDSALHDIYGMLKREASEPQESPSDANPAPL